jgi:hypothetical protein
MGTKPTVGRIVHFYDYSLATSRDKDGIALNGQGAGPYPALVVQTFDGPYVNLLVHAWGGDWREGSVSEKSENNNSRYWVWPPRERQAITA